MIRLILSIIAVIFIFIECSASISYNNIEDSDSLSFSELINEALKTEDACEFETICEQIYDTLSLKPDYMWYYPIINLDEKDGSHCIYFERERSEMVIDDNLLFRITLNEQDVRYENGLIPVDELSDSLDLYMLEPDSICNCYVVYNTKLWGRVKFPRRGVLLGMRMQEDYVTDDFYVFFEYLRKVISYYDEKLNRISYQKWGKGFSFLSVEQKFEVIDYFKLNIILFFYR